MRFDAFFAEFPLVMPGLDPGIHQSSSEMDRRIKSGDDTVQDHRIGAAGLTMRQRSSAFWTDPEQPKGVFINSKPRRGLLSGAVRLR
jgi:hypothetical protein